MDALALVALGAVALLFVSRKAEAAAPEPAPSPLEAPVTVEGQLAEIGLPTGSFVPIISLLEQILTPILGQDAAIANLQQAEHENLRAIVDAMISTGRYDSLLDDATDINVLRDTLIADYPGTLTEDVYNTIAHRAGYWMVLRFREEAEARGYVVPTGNAWLDAKMRYWADLIGIPIRETFDVWGADVTSYLGDPASAPVMIG